MRDGGVAPRISAVGVVWLTERPSKYCRLCWRQRKCKRPSVHVTLSIRITLPLQAITSLKDTIEIKAIIAIRGHLISPHGDCSVAG